MKTEIKNLWPTEVMFGKLESSDIQDVSLELLTNLDLISTPGGISDTNLASDQFNLPILQQFLKDHVVPAFEKYCREVFKYELQPGKFKLKPWASNGADKYSLGFHNHSGAQLSAVFYFIVENTAQHGGKFNFHDPRFNANRGMISEFKFKHDDYQFMPASGDFIIFPSYLYHSITTFHGVTRLIMPVDLFIND
jgi:hypothetical protein